MLLAPHAVLLFTTDVGSMVELMQQGALQINIQTECAQRLQKQQTRSETNCLEKFAQSGLGQAVKLRKA